MKFEDIHNENDVRLFIKECVGSDRLEWFEPAFGGSVGHPDVGISFDWFDGNRLQIPFELKCWYLNVKGMGLRCDMRPSQRRYHLKAAMEGRRSGIIAVNLGHKRVSGSFLFPEMYLIPGWACPVEPIIGEHRVGWEILLDRGDAFGHRRLYDRLDHYVKNVKFWDCGRKLV